MAIELVCSCGRVVRCDQPPVGGQTRCPACGAVVSAGDYSPAGAPAADSRATGTAPGDIGGTGMSTVGTRLQKNRRSRAELSPMTEPSRADTPYLLLWSIGVLAFVLCTVAFVLWGITGTRTLFDMMIALCT